MEIMKLRGIFLEIAWGNIAPSVLIWVSSTLTKFLCSFAGNSAAAGGKWVPHYIFGFPWYLPYLQDFISLCVPTRRGEKNLQELFKERMLHNQHKASGPLERSCPWKHKIILYQNNASNMVCMCPQLSQGEGILCGAFCRSLYYIITSS